MGPQNGAPEEPTAKPQPEQKSTEHTNKLDGINPAASQPLAPQRGKLEQVIALDVNEVWKKLTRNDVTIESRYALAKLHRESSILPIEAVKERHQMILQLACETLIENGCKIKILHWNVHFHLYHLKKTYPALMREFHALRDKWMEESAKPKDPNNEIVAQIIHGILHDCRVLLLRPPKNFESGRDELLERVLKQIAEHGCELHSFQKRRLYRLLGLLREEIPVVVEGQDVVDDDYDKAEGGEIDLEIPKPREQGLEVAKEEHDVNIARFIEIDDDDDDDDAESQSDSDEEESIDFDLAQLDRIPYAEEDEMAEDEMVESTDEEDIQEEVLGLVEDQVNDPESTSTERVEKVYVEIGKLLMIKNKQIEGNTYEWRMIKAIDDENAKRMEDKIPSIWEKPSTFQLYYITKGRKNAQPEKEEHVTST